MPEPFHHLTVRVKRGAAGLTDLKSDWNSIFSSLAEPHFFHRYEWIASFLHHLEPDPDSVYFFEVMRDTTPIAIMPLKKGIASYGQFLSLRQWELPRHSHVPLCDILVSSSELRSPILDALFACLAERADFKWDVLILSNLLDDATAATVCRESKPPRSLTQKQTESMSFQTTAYDQAVQGTSGHFRRNLRRQLKKLEQRGRVEFRFARDESALVSAFNALLAVEGSGWKGHSGQGSAIALHRELTDFYGSLMEGFSKNGQCMINQLLLDGRPIATQLCLLTNSTLSLLKIGYDEALSAEAPGHQLLDAAIRYCCEQPDISRLSLVTGPKWASERWHPQTESVSRIVVYGPSLRGRLAYHAHRFKQRLADRSARRKSAPTREQATDGDLATERD